MTRIEPPIPPEATDATSGVLTDVHFGKPLTIAGRDVALFALIVVLGVIMAMYVSLSFPRAFPGADAVAVLGTWGVLTGLVVIVNRRVRRVRLQRRVRAMLARIDQRRPHATLCAAVDAVRGADMAYGFRLILETLLQTGRAGTTLRIAGPTERTPVEPIAYPFEAQPLNQSQATLIAHSNRPSELPAPPPLTTGLLRRNLTLAGGLVVGLMIGAAWLVLLVIAVKDRRITWELLLWSLMLAATFTLPMFGNSRRQWFSLPGALLERRAGWLQSRWKLHLFERRSSALCVIHLGRGVWMVFVADPQASARRMLTRTEAEFLLRAWLSPLPPPPLERLSDFA